MTDTVCTTSTTHLLHQRKTMNSTGRSKPTRRRGKSAPRTLCKGCDAVTDGSRHEHAPGLRPTWRSAGAISRPPLAAVRHDRATATWRRMVARRSTDARLPQGGRASRADRSGEPTDLQLGAELPHSILAWHRKRQRSEPLRRSRVRRGVRAEGRRDGGQAAEPACKPRAAATDVRRRRGVRARRGRAPRLPSRSARCCASSARAAASRRCTSGRSASPRGPPLRGRSWPRPSV